MANKIEVDLVADLKLALDKLGMGKDIEKAFASKPGLVKAIAGGIGLDLKNVLSKSAESGVKEGLAKAASSNANIFARLEEKLKGKGGLLSGFLRYEVGRGAMGAIGMGGGIGGRLGGAALAAGGDKVPGLTLGLAAFTVALSLATHAIEALINAAREGAKLYEQSRALGISTIQASSFIKTLGSVGIDEGSALRLAAYGEFGRGGRAGGGVRGNVAGEMISSGMRGGMSALEIQQIRNMSQEINQAWAQTREAAIESAQVARANFSIQMELAVLKIKLQTTLQELSSLLEPIIYGLSRTIGALLDEINKDLAWWIEQLQKLHLIPSETSNPSRLTPFTRDTHITSLEKMGLVIGGHQDAVKNYLKDISKNTGDIVKAIAIKTTFSSSVALPHGVDSTRLTPAQHATYQAMTHGGYTPPISGHTTNRLESVFDRFVDRMQQAELQSRRNELYGPAAINFP